MPNIQTDVWLIVVTKRSTSNCSLKSGHVLQTRYGTLLSSASCLITLRLAATL